MYRVTWFVHGCVSEHNAGFKTKMQAMAFVQALPIPRDDPDRIVEKIRLWKEIPTEAAPEQPEADA